MSVSSHLPAILSSDLPGTTEPRLPVPGSTQPQLLSAQAAVPTAVALQQRAKAPSTLRLYGALWRRFVSWCEKQDPPLAALPASSATIAAYLAALAATPKVAGANGRAFGRQTAADHRTPETLRVHAAAIQHYHQAQPEPTAPCDHPTVTRLLTGLERTWAGVRPTRRGKDALTVADLAKLVNSQDRATVRGIQRVAILLLGFAGAFRRSELTSVDNLVYLAVDDLDLRDEGLVVTLRKSKTDQTGAGRVVAVPYATQPTYCPVRAVLAWLACLDAAGTLDGPLFRAVAGDTIGTAPLEGAAVARVVKACARDAGYREAAVERLAAHSLRSGFVTEAVAGGAEAWAVAETTGHKSLDTLRRYIKAHDPFKNVAKVL